MRLRRELGYYGNDSDDDQRNNELEDEGVGEVFGELRSVFAKFSEGEIAQSKVHDKHKESTEGHHEVVGSEFDDSE